jgi:hypothetical protein
MALERRFTCDRCGHQKTVDSLHESADQPPVGWLVVKVGTMPHKQVADYRLLCTWCVTDLKAFLDQKPAILCETPDGETKCRCGCRDSNAGRMPAAAATVGGQG